MDQVDCVVIGAGVVGLAVARALALQGREVMVLEAADAIGTGTSSRNSEVIHAASTTRKARSRHASAWWARTCCMPMHKSGVLPTSAVAS